MNVFVVVRNLSVYSEQWLTRQLLAHDLFTAVFSAGKVSGWKASLPAVEIPRQDGFLYRFFKKVIPSFFHANYQEKWLSKQVKQGDKVVFHYIDFALNFKSFIRSAKCDYFIYCHGYDITWDKRDIQNPEKKYFRASYIEEVIEIASFVKFICNSEDTRQKLIRIGVPQERLLLNYFGVQQSAISNIVKAPVFTILYLGRLVDFKGPDYVIKAFELALQKGLKGQLQIAGDGVLRPYIELLVRRSPYKNYIQLLGAVDAGKANTLLQAAHIFTAHNCTGELSRQEEAFGVSIIEAMSLGLPVVTGRNGGVVESVVHNETGILIEPFDVESHAEAFLKLYNDQAYYQRLSANARTVAAQKFSMQQEYQNLQKILGIE